MWGGRQHGGHQEAVAIQTEGHFKLSQQFNVLLAVLLGKEFALEDVR